MNTTNPTTTQSTSDQTFEKSKPMKTKFNLKWLRLMASFILLFAAFAQVGPALADTCVVTTAADSGAGSLREKIADPVCDTITFDNDYIIVLASHLAIDRAVAIDGAGHNVTVSGNDVDRVFVVNPGASLSINHLTVANGAAWTRIGTIFNDADGGGIHNQGTLTVTDSVFSGNGAYYGNWGHGGAIFSAYGTLTVVDTTFTDNAAMFGGGIYIYDGTLILTNSTLSDNDAAGGGGIMNIRGTATLTNCTFSGNSSGAFVTHYQTSTLTNCTFSGNTGGSIFSDYSATTTLVNTIVVNSGEENNCYTLYDATISGSNSLADDASCGAGFVNSASILLGPLANNGGATLTMALLPGSAAIDAGDDAACPATDQRGVARPQGAHCDIGAFEVEPTPPANTAPTANPGGPYLGAVNTAIAFDGSLSSDPEADPLTYSWRFGDGYLSTVASPTHSYEAVGIYTVCLSVIDRPWSYHSACTLAVVYDPSAGFVTGGGWIDSPAGAYKADESLTGKATFGFMAKYQKGASTPIGNTAFQFDLAGLSFASQSYDWLVVNQAGTNAQFKGSGLINGAADPNGNAYKFMLWAGDGSGANGADTFRIRIWSEDTAGEHDIYDNGVDQAIGAGNIVVHRK